MFQELNLFPSGCTGELLWVKSTSFVCFGFFFLTLNNHVSLCSSVPIRLAECLKPSVPFSRNPDGKNKIIPDSFNRTRMEHTVKLDIGLFIRRRIQWTAQ